MKLPSGWPHPWWCTNAYPHRSRLWRSQIAVYQPGEHTCMHLLVKKMFYRRLLHFSGPSLWNKHTEERTKSHTRVRPKQVLLVVCIILLPYFEIVFFDFMSYRHIGIRNALYHLAGSIDITAESLVNNEITTDDDIRDEVLENMRKPFWPFEIVNLYRKNFE